MIVITMPIGKDKVGYFTGFTNTPMIGDIPNASPTLSPDVKRYPTMQAAQQVADKIGGGAKATEGTIN